MGSQVALDAALELRRADELLEHVNDRRALLVGDGVERVEHVVVGFDRLADASRADQAVGRHRPSARAEAVEGHSPVGVPGLECLVGHPGGERLVEPDVVPPGVGDQVAEPHVRELVGRDARLCATENRRLFARRHQQESR